MTGKIEARLAELGITLPEAPAPVASYLPYVVTGKLIVLSGQVTFKDGKLQYIGTLGDSLTVEEGAQSARLCALNLLAQVKNACDGDLDRIKRVVRLGGFVACTADFTDQPKVMNGASDLMAEIFGDAGRHARTAVGVPSLPLGVSVEIDGIFELG
jgi:enamine deaminase RidA (YjgF/YER057c/UK114 family)